MVSNWKNVKFEDVCSINAPMVNPKESQYSLLPHIGNENIEKRTGKLLKYNLVKDDNLISGKYYFTKDNVLYGKINPQFAKVTYPQFDGLCSADMYPICCIKDIIPAFLKYVLLTTDFTSYTVSVSMRSGMPKVNRNELADYQFLIPPICEQKHIAKALSDIDNMISSLEKLIKKKKAVKQGAMQELLTGKKRLPGFSGEWRKLVLGDLCYICRGGSPRPIQNYLTTSDDGYNWIKIGDVEPNAKYIISTQEKIVESGISKSRRVYKGDFILSNSMSFGRPYILKIDGCIHDGWLAIQNYFNYFDTDFLYYTLGSEYVFEQYIQMAAGSSVQNLNKDKVAKLELFVPPIEEQSAIASILSDMDNEIDALEQKLKKARQLKQGMMQQLLTGKIRLV